MKGTQFGYESTLSLANQGGCIAIKYVEPVMVRLPVLQIFQEKQPQHGTYLERTCPEIPDPPPLLVLTCLENAPYPTEPPPHIWGRGRAVVLWP